MLGNHIKLDRQVDDTKREFLINSESAYIEMITVLAKLVRARKRTRVIIEEVSDEKN